MSKLKLPIILVIVLAAAGAGLFASGMIGGKPEGPTKKHAVEPIALAEPFVVNLADADATRLLAFNVAVQLEPMDDIHWAAFSAPAVAATAAQRRHPARRRSPRTRASTTR